jgi:leader peptidase (prepilin peptidase)/N-methyltransferase
MDVFFLGVFALLGLIIGSFLNALIWRMHSGESLLTRSMCPRCHALIHWYDNIPVLSFILLRGRCRACRQSIAWQYPAVELATAIGFSIIGYVALPDGGWGIFSMHGWALWNFWGTLVLWWILFAVLLATFVYDIRHMEIPMVLVWIALGVAVIHLVLLDWPAAHVLSGWSWRSSELVWGLVAGGGIFILFTALSLGTRERLMGWGDAWLALPLGMLLGWMGTIWMVAIGSGIGSVIGLGMMLRQRGTLQTALPFAPFLILGFYSVIVLRFVWPMYF